MSKRILGRDLEVSSIGLGCMGMSHAYGRPSDKTEAKNLLAKAVDLGYTMFDTAEVYGTAENPHHNETLLGEILKPYRNQIKIATKGGLHFDENSTVVNKNLVPDSRPEVLKKIRRRFFTETSDESSGSLLYPSCGSNNSYRRNSRCNERTDRSGKDYTLGNFRSYRGNHSKSAQSLPAYSGTESLFYDVQKLRIIVSGTERTTDWFRGFFSIGKWFSDLQI